MTFLDLSTALREARIAQGLSIEDIADKLKSTSRLVRDLEEANMAGLPHAVYTRGFIRTYAASVKLDLAEYQAIIDETWSLDAQDDYEGKLLLAPSVYRKRKSKPLVLLGFLVLCGALAGAYWMYSQPTDITVPVSGAPIVSQSNGASGNGALSNGALSNGASSNGASGTASGAHTSTKTEQQGTLHQDVQNNTSTQNNGVLTIEERTARDLAKGQSATAKKDAGLNSGSASSSNDTHNANTASSSEPKSNVSQAVDADSVAQATAAQDSTAEKSLEKTPEKPVDKAVEKSPATTPSQHTVVITASQDCWIRLVPDGEKSKELVLKKGNSLTQVFKKNLEMRFGNPAGVSLVYNGKDMPAFGKSGKAITVMYPPKN